MSDLNRLMDAWFEQVSLEEKKLDPVGKADADIDNDGDVDSSDEYLKNRRKKIGQAMKKDKKDESYGKKKEDVDVEEACGKKHYKEEKVECPQCKGDGCDHCDDKGYHMKKEEVDQIDEISPTTLNRAGDMALKSRDAHKKAGHDSMAKKRDNQAGKFYHSAIKKNDAKMKSFRSGQNESMEETLLSVPSERKVVSWTEFSEKYDEFTFKGKKRPQDRPLGKSDEKPTPSKEFDHHTKGATPPEGMFDKESEKSKAFIKMHQQSDPEWENKEDEGHDDVSKAGRGVKKQSPDRGGDHLNVGDKNIINPITQKV